MTLGANLTRSQVVLCLSQREKLCSNDACIARVKKESEKAIEPKLKDSIKINKPDYLPPSTLPRKNLKTGVSLRDRIKYAPSTRRRKEIHFPLVF